MPSIKQYRGKTWRAIVRRTGFKPASKTFPTKAAAENWATVVEAALLEGRQVDVKKLRATTVADLFTKFRDEECPKRKGGRAEKIRINRLLRTADFVNRRLDQILPIDVTAWRDARLREVTKATVAREMNQISSIFSHAISEWHVPLPYNPCKLVSRPAGYRKRRKRRINASEAQELVKACGVVEPQPPRLAVQWAGYCLLLAIETAMRIGEICALRKDHVFLEQRFVRLPDTKNGDARDVPLSRRAVELMRILLAGELSVVTRKIKARGDRLIPYAVGTLGAKFREVRNDIDLRDLHFHDSRHEAATRLSRKLTNVLELAAVTGHRDLKSLQVYFNPTASELADKLD